MSTLTENIKAYEGMQNMLKADHFGKWVVFHDEELVDLYDTFEAAADDAVMKFGRGPYLIRKIGEGPITLPASVLYNKSAFHGSS